MEATTPRRRPATRHAAADRPAASGPAPSGDGAATPEAPVLAPSGLAVAPADAPAERPVAYPGLPSPAVLAPLADAMAERGFSVGTIAEALTALSHETSVGGHLPMEETTPIARAAVSAAAAPPSVRWLLGHADEHRAAGDTPIPEEEADAFARLLALLDEHAGRDHAFLRAIPTRDGDDPVAGPADFALEDRTPGVLRSSPQELVGTLRDLLQTAPAVRLLTGIGDDLPTSVHTRPRLGFVHSRRAPRRPARSGAPDAPDLALRPGERYGQCELTGRFFACPDGAAVPALIYDDEAPGCESAGVRYHVVHPGLVVAGPEYVLAALWQHVEAEVTSAADTLTRAVEALTLAVAAGPEDLEASGAVVAEGLTEWAVGNDDAPVLGLPVRPYMPGVAGLRVQRQVPRGWRDVPSWHAA